MARSVVRGTPYTHIGPSGNAGHRGGESKPSGYEGTIGHQYGRDEIDTRKTGGTPFHSERGNPPNARREAFHGPKGGIVLSENGLNMNDKEQSIGAGVVLDDGQHSYPDGYQATGNHQTMDSPVPEHASRFEPDFIPMEDAEHLGNALGHLAAPGANHDLRKLGGVMSRGMETTSDGEAETSEERADSGATG